MRLKFVSLSTLFQLTRFSLCGLIDTAAKHTCRNLYETGNRRAGVMLLYSSQATMDIDFWPQKFVVFSFDTKVDSTFFCRNTSKCFKIDEGSDCRYCFELFKTSFVICLFFFVVVQLCATPDIISFKNS